MTKIKKIKLKKTNSFRTLILIILIFFNCFTQNSCTNTKFPNGVVKIFFCGQYISDANSNQLDVLKEFEKQFGIKVCACQTFDSNEQLYAKLKYSKNDFDVILASDYMVCKLNKEQMLQKIDKNQLKNYSEINSAFKGSKWGFDPTDDVSVPYTWGTIGLIYNEQAIEKLTNQNTKKFINDFNCLFNEKLENEILMFSNSKDSFAIAQKALNNSINTTNLSEINEAAAILKKQKKLVQIYGVDEITDKMINDEATIAPAFSGDAINMIKENKNLKFYVPEKSIIYIDSMCIPKGSKNIENAHKFIDFMCDPKVAVQNCNYSGFATTINGATKLINNTPICSYNQIKNFEIQHYLGEKIEQTIETLWEKILI